MSEAQLLHRGAQLNRPDINKLILALCVALNVSLLHPRVIGPALAVLEGRRKRGDIRRAYNLLLTTIEEAGEP